MNSQPPYGSNPQNPQTSPPGQSWPQQPTYQTNPGSPQQPVYQAAPMMAVGVPVAPVVVHDPGKGQAITSLVLGIIGLVFAFVPVCGAPVAIVLGIVGTIMGAIGRKSVTGKGMAIAGLVMSILALVLSLGIIVYLDILGASISTTTH